MRIGLLSTILLCAACQPPANRAAPYQPEPGDDPPPSGASSPPAVIEVAEPIEETEEEAPATPVTVTGEDGWTAFHAGAARRGRVELDAIKQPRIAWSAEVGVQSWLNTPLAIDNLVIVPSSGARHNTPDPKDGVYALDLKSGKRRWFAKLPQDANGASVHDKRVFVSCDDGNLYALELATGKVSWKQAGNGKMYTHPLPVGDLVISGDAGGYLHAYQQSDGKQRWEVQTIGALRGGAASDGTRVYAVSQGGEALALTLAGKVLWRKQLDRPPWSGKGRREPIEAYSVPVLGDGMLIVPYARDTYYKDEPALLAISTKNGAEKWRARGPGQWGNVRSTPALSDGTLVYAEPYSGDLVGINARDGRMRWRKTVGPCYFPSWASPAAARDVAYVPRFDGAVYAVNVNSGKLLWELYLGEKKRAGNGKAPGAGNNCEWDVANGFPLYSPAAIAKDGTLLAGSAEGYLYAITGR